MRVTNPMLTNRMMININKNMRYLDKLYNQLSTGKNIMYPSDDPIIASRALKFRTNVTETQQYQRNVAQGLSWMEVTEGAFKNVTSIMERLRELAVQGASDENRLDDRQKIVTDMQELMQQLGTEMNVTYAGRYVFSGFRTDQAPTFEEDYSGTFTITQTFNKADIEQMATYQRTETGIVVNEDVDVLKLAYDQSVLISGLKIGTTEVNINEVSIDKNDPKYSLDAYKPPASGATYIKETGEIILSSGLATQLKADQQLEITYDKTDFKKGEQNPIVYFKCIDKSTNQSYNMDNQEFEYEFGTNTRIKINTLAKDTFTDKMYADLMGFCDSILDMRVSTLEELTSPPLNMSTEDANQRILDEEDQIKNVMQDRFNNLLEIVDKHAGNVTKEHTDMGSRMNRLELIENRLIDDRLSYEKLLSDNEDIDYMETTMYMNAAQSVYQASLQTGAKIMQLSLANYI